MPSGSFWSLLETACLGLGRPGPELSFFNSFPPFLRRPTEALEKWFYIQKKIAPFEARITEEGQIQFWGWFWSHLGLFGAFSAWPVLARVSLVQSFVLENFFFPILTEDHPSRCKSSFLEKLLVSQDFGLELRKRDKSGDNYSDVIKKRVGFDFCFFWWTSYWNVWISDVEILEKWHILRMNVR